MPQDQLDLEALDFLLNTRPPLLVREPVSELFEVRQEVGASGRRVPFKISAVIPHIISWLHGSCTSYAALQRQLPPEKLQEVVLRLARQVFYIEPVNREVTTTRYCERWHNGADFFSFGPQDPRWASFGECKRIFLKLVDDLAVALNDEGRKRVLQSFLDHSLVAYELPLDYERDTVDEDFPSLHLAGNLSWVWSDLSASTIKFRSILEEMDQAFQYTKAEDGRMVQVTEPLSKIMKEILRNKIEVKTYRTDRAQTGDYQSNREKRWEAHPEGVQFASRKAAWGVEYKLLLQLVHFDGFPVDVRHYLVEKQIIPPNLPPTRCPITYDRLNFEAFVSEVRSPVWGRSDYQVGHLNPLKAVGREDPSAGHTASNIAWISQDGNRIQGSLSLAETEELLRRIEQNRREALLSGA